VDSKQEGIHHQLFDVLDKHLQSDYKKPISTYSLELFSTIENLRKKLALPIILDSGCGTGASSKNLAFQNPNSLIIGIDKSAHRLSLGGMCDAFRLQNNLLLLKMDLVDFWRLATMHNWKLEKHYLLYPNPWPKTKALNKRWHGHPVFPYILQLGGKLELRTNWRLYAEEFHLAINHITPGISVLEKFTCDKAISLFEQKYLKSGHSLYCCHSELNQLVVNIRQTGAL